MTVSSSDVLILILQRYARGWRSADCAGARNRNGSLIECVCCRRDRVAIGDSKCCSCDDCFPASARLSLENSESVSMKGLKIGDRVQTGQ